MLARSVASAIAATLLFASFPAHADGTLDISGESGLVYTVHRTRAAEDAPAVARCVVTCTLHLPLGAYRVRVEGKDVPSSDEIVHLRHSAVPVHVVGGGGSPSARSAGLVVGIVGLSLSAVALAIAGVESIPPESRDYPAARLQSQQNVATGMAIFAGVAFAAGITGWIVRASNGASLRVRESPGLRVAWILPSASGGVLGVGGVF